MARVGRPAQCPRARRSGPRGPRPLAGLPAKQPHQEPRRRRYAGAPWAGLRSAIGASPLLGLAGRPPQHLLRMAVTAGLVPAGGGRAGVRSTRGEAALAAIERGQTLSPRLPRPAPPPPTACSSAPQPLPSPLAGYGTQSRTQRRRPVRRGAGLGGWWVIGGRSCSRARSRSGRVTVSDSAARLSSKRCQWPTPSRHLRWAGLRVQVVLSVGCAAGPTWTAGVLTFIFFRSLVTLARRSRSTAARGSRPTRPGRKFRSFHHVFTLRVCGLSLGPGRGLGWK